MQETALLGEVRHYSRYVNNATTSATQRGALMTADQYLQNILVHKAVDTGIFEKTL
jgi:hypothetical protein